MKSDLLDTEIPSVVMTATEAMAFLDITRSVFYDHVRHGVIPRRPDGRFDSRETLWAYIRHLRAAADRRGASAGETLSIERATLARERAAKIAMENKQRRSELLEFDRVVEAYAADLAELRAGLSVIPSRIGEECATMTPAEVAQHVAQLIDEALIAMRSAQAASGEVKADQIGSGEE